VTQRRAVKPAATRVMALCACDTCGGFASQAFAEIQRLRSATSGVNHKLLAEVAVKQWLETIVPEARTGALSAAVQRWEFWMDPGSW
jgi:hypothetical protein